jgi:hypothetical protein
MCILFITYVGFSHSLQWIMFLKKLLLLQWRISSLDRWCLWLPPSLIGLYVVCWSSSQSQIYLMTDGQSASLLLYLSPSRTHDQFFFLFQGNSFKTFAVFVMGHPLWGEELSIFFSAVSPQSESRKTHNRTLLPYLRIRPPYLCYSGIRWPSGTGVHFHRLAVIQWRYFLPPPYWDNSVGFKS